MERFFLLLPPSQSHSRLPIETRCLVRICGTCAQCYERFTAVTSYADGDGATLREYLCR